MPDQSTGAYDVRVLLSRDGQVDVSHSLERSDADSAPRSIGFASEPIDKDDPFHYHKTTRRDVYERALGRSSGDDVILWNTAGEITETCIANVVFKIDGEWCTPPVACGLLAGTYRNCLLKKGEIREEKIRIEQAKAGTEVMLINSVRGKFFRMVV